MIELTLKVQQRPLNDIDTTVENTTSVLKEAAEAATPISIRRQVWWII